MKPNDTEARRVLAEERWSGFAFSKLTDVSNPTFCRIMKGRFPLSNYPGVLAVVHETLPADVAKRFIAACEAAYEREHAG